MSEKFTPGPWEKEYSARRDEWEIYIDGDCIALASVYPNVPETAANAALIAAAPDMYDALEELQRVYVSGNFDTEFKPALNKARAALAKARGE